MSACRRPRAVSRGGGIGCIGGAGRRRRPTQIRKPFHEDDFFGDDSDRTHFCERGVGLVAVDVLSGGPFRLWRGQSAWTRAQDLSQQPFDIADAVLRRQIPAYCRCRRPLRSRCAALLRPCFPRLGDSLVHGAPSPRGRPALSQRSGESGALKRAYCFSAGASDSI